MFRRETRPVSEDPGTISCRRAVAAVLDHVRYGGNQYSFHPWTSPSALRRMWACSCTLVETAIRQAAEISGRLTVLEHQSPTAYHRVLFPHLDRLESARVKNAETVRLRVASALAPMRGVRSVQTEDRARMTQKPDRSVEKQWKPGKDTSAS